MKQNSQFPGASGLILEEPLIFEKSVKGRTACSVPKDDVPEIDAAEMDVHRYFRSSIDGLPEVSEVDVVRHYLRLSTWNYSLDHGLYPLGSCTMKYNPKINEAAAAIPGFAHLHPGTPEPFAQGALRVMYELQNDLAEIAGLDAVSLQPSAGAQGELTGMLMIKAYHLSRNEPQRNLVLIPDSAHGTNPASSVVAGLRTQTLPSGDDGCLNPEALRPYLNQNLAGIMVTNPSTLGLFEKNFVEFSCRIHDAGGLVYMDGANLNAMMGVVKPGDLGVDVMHINLHKTFSTPHGGGGPGSGPVAVTRALEPFLPVPRIVLRDGRYSLDWNHPQSIGKIHCFYGNFGIMLRAYTYIRSMGPDGIREACENAVLNANYIKEKLKTHFHIAHDRLCKHECVFDDKYQQEYGITTLDIAKRLMDYGFHPPTIYFPLIVKGALMIEPTETESKETLDQFIEAMIRIAEECKTDPDLVKHAPVRAKRRRLDETLAARKPILKWSPGVYPE